MTTISENYNYYDVPIDYKNKCIISPLANIDINNFVALSSYPSYTLFISIFAKGLIVMCLLITISKSYTLLFFFSSIPFTGNFSSYTNLPYPLLRFIISTKFPYSPYFITNTGLLLDSSNYCQYGTRTIWKFSTNNES